MASANEFSALTARPSIMRPWSQHVDTVNPVRRPARQSHEECRGARRRHHCDVVRGVARKGPPPRRGGWWAATSTRAKHVPVVRRPRDVSNSRSASAIALTDDAIRATRRRRARGGDGEATGAQLPPAASAVASQRRVSAVERDEERAHWSALPRAAAERHPTAPAPPSEGGCRPQSTGSESPAVVVRREDDAHRRRRARLTGRSLSRSAASATQNSTIAAPAMPR